MKQNKIKAVEMVRQIRDTQYEQVKYMSHEERIAFYREKAQKLFAKLDKQDEASQQRAMPAEAA